MVSYDTIHTYDIRYLPLSRESTMDVSEREDITHHCGSIESIDSRARLYEPEEDRPSLATHESDDEILRVEATLYFHSIALFNTP